MEDRVCRRLPCGYKYKMNEALQDKYPSPQAATTFMGAVIVVGLRFSWRCRIYGLRQMRREELDPGSTVFFTASRNK